MELDVHITREREEPWGFEFYGGANCNVPLTIDKVLPSSAALAAGLQAGDVVARLGDRLATELSQHEALAIVAESGASLSLGICRGLYDPVLDDFEPIYEPIDQADSDRRSEPTEVYPQDLSLDDPNILDPSITDPSLWDSGYATRPLTETRSLTASPFVPNTKPYRPFSTEPLEVTPLDDPIVLNANFKDTLNILNDNAPTKVLDPEDDLLRLLPLDRNIEAKFKLPVSEKYDPDSNNKIRSTLEKCTDGGKRDNQQIEHELACYSNKSEASTDVTVTKEVHNIKCTKKVTVQGSLITGNEIIKNDTTFGGIEKIEQVALEVVEESIGRAVSVTEDIQKEIEEERASMARELQVEEIEVSSENKIHIEELETKEEMRKSVSKKSGMTKSVQYETDTMDESKPESEGKQKAYMIGLQTIPHIKGFVQSSHHFDLLLRTFFVHLTDVMVALSRFILTQPMQELESKAETVVKEKLIKEFFEQCNTLERKDSEHRHEEKKQTVQTTKNIKIQENDIRQETKIVQAKQDIKTPHEMQNYEHDMKKTKQTDELVCKKQQDIELVSENVEVRKKSGAEMAQRTQKKSRDLTQKMDAVITEFATKTGIDDRLEETEHRSRSRIEKEVMRDSDPLEWLDKVDSRKASQEITLEKGWSSYSESKSSKRSETKLESRTTKVKPGKQMYIATVESHVYTNKDAILEDQVAEMSETASVQNCEETNTALESFEAISTENVAMCNIIQSEEKQQAVEVITNALQEVVQDKQEILEVVNDFKSQVTEQHSKPIMQESHVSVAAESTEIVSESKVKEFNVCELKERKALAVQEEIYKTAAVEFVDVPLEAITETTEFKVKQQQAVSKIESLAIAVAESIDVVVDDSKVETFESQTPVSKRAMVKSEETFKTAAVGVTEVAFEMTEDKHSERAKTSEVTIKEEPQHLAVAGIIETKTELCKEPKKPAEDEYASLKIVKEQIIDAGDSVEITSQIELNVKKSLEIDISSSLQSSYQSTCQEIGSLKEISSSVQEMSSSTQQSSKSAKSLHINTSLAQQFGQISDQSDENIDTPTPSTVPPTPLTDEYVFRLQIPLPKNQGTVVVEDSPDREDPYIVKKGLIPYIETTIEEQIIYDPPLPTPPEEKVQPPVYTKPGLKGGETPLFKKAYIREIERKSSLLASAIDETIKSIEEYKEEVGIESKRDVTIQLSKLTNTREKLTNGTSNKENGFEKECTLKENIQELSKEKSKTQDETNGTESAKEGDDLPGFKPVVFNPEAYQARLYQEVTRGTEPEPFEMKPYVTESGELLGTVQGIVDGLEDATVDEEVARELGKPGMTEDKIAELISGESEMLREAHVMGLNRVLKSHMTRPDDSSVDFHQIKPLYDSLKDSEVLKVLNDEIKREIELKKKDEKKWTTFLQKPKGPIPRAKFGSNGYLTEDNEIKEYKVKIVKQPKPKVAPDYKSEDFETGPLPWEQRALNEPVPSPVPPEEPILVPDEAEFFEAVDPLPESEVPDLEDTGIPLPPTPPPPAILVELPPEPQAPDLPEPEPEPEPEVEEEAPAVPNMDQNAMAEQLVNTVKSMVDPNAPLEQQLCQMRSQLAALAQLPCVIQQSLELLSRQLCTMSRQETHQACNEAQMNMESPQEIHENTVACIQETQNKQEALQNYQEVMQNCQEGTQKEEQKTVTIEEVQEKIVTAEEAAALKREQEVLIEKQRKSEKEMKERKEKVRLDQESRQVKQRAPRVGKPRSVFGPLNPEERPVVLPGGRRWKGPEDAYNEQSIAEMIQAQSEMIQGKVMGINFMKYEKPPISLDHLQHSATYKLIHNIEETPLKRTDLRTPVVAEADYRERCRSATPNMQVNGRM